jgi:hypothetical protein
LDPSKQKSAVSSALSGVRDVIPTQPKDGLDPGTIDAQHEAVTGLRTDDPLGSSVTTVPV